MAIWAIPRWHLLVRIPLTEEMSSEAWKLLFTLKSDSKCDGEVLAVRSDGGVGKTLAEKLEAAGFRGPNFGKTADFVSVYGSEVDDVVKPDWLSIVLVDFFSEDESSGFAWKLKVSQVYNLLNHPRSIFRKGYTCDWEPHIGKI